MSWKDYPYTSYVGNEYALIKEPRINVVLSKNGKTMNQLAIIDSGAHTTMISEEVADFFGIDLSKCTKRVIGGIVGEDVECFECDFTLKVDGFKEAITIPVIFVPGIRTNMLLGQRGFFDHFRIMFYKAKNSFSLISINEENEHMEGSGDEYGFATSLRKK